LMVSRIGLFSWPPWGGWYLVLGGGRILRRDSHGQLKRQVSLAAQRAGWFFGGYGLQATASNKKLWLDMDMTQVSQAFGVDSDAVLPGPRSSSLALASAEAWSPDMIQASLELGDDCYEADWARWNLQHGDVREGRNTPATAMGTMISSRPLHLSVRTIKNWSLESKISRWMTFPRRCRSKVRMVPKIRAGVPGSRLLGQADGVELDRLRVSANATLQRCSL
jgi:hypothetical protein